MSSKIAKKIALYGIPYHVFYILGREKTPDNFPSLTPFTRAGLCSLNGGKDRAAKKC